MTTHALTQAPLRGAREPGELGHALDRFREAGFAGRVAAVDGLLEVVRGAPHRVAYVCGGPGIGKTTVLRALVRRLRRADTPTVWIDARDLPRSGPAAAQAIHAALAETNSREGAGLVLIVDAFEARAELERWWRERLLPSLPADVRVVFAGRIRLELEWTTDPGWRELLRVEQLPPLPAADAERVLACQSISDARRRELHELGGGYPLLLTHPADGTARACELARRLLRDAPDPLHARALQAAALVPRMTEDLLATMVPDAEVASIYRWLGRQACIDATPRGLALHEPLRLPLRTDLAASAPAVRASLLAAACRFHLDRFAQLPLHDSLSLAMQAADLPVPPCERRDLTAQRPSRDDVARARATIETCEGPDAARVFDHWHERGATMRALRGRAGEHRGFYLALRLDRHAPADTDGDPATRAAVRALRARGIDAHREPVAVIRWAAPRCLVGFVLREAAAAADDDDIVAGAFVTGDVEAWQSVRGPHRPAPLDGAEFTVDDRRFATCWLDLRGRPPRERWREALAHHSAQLEQLATTPASPASPIDETTFRRAVKAALKAIDCPEVLAHNPLVGCRLVDRRVSPDASLPERAHALADLVREACARLSRSPRDKRLHEALDKAFLHPAPKQEAAARDLGMGYSTYRRHLARAIARVTEALWIEERTGR